MTETDPTEAIPDDKTPPMGHPAWLLRCRVPGSMEWRKQRVIAPSLAEAVGLMRGQGFQIDERASRVEPAGPDEAGAVGACDSPSRLRCTRCEYPLDGLVIQDTCANCPECGFPQLLLAYSPHPKRRLSGIKTAGLIVLLLVVGGPMTVFVLAYLVVLIRVFFG